MNKLYENKKIANATHNILAYRILQSDPHSVVYQGCDDDGETHAGSRMLHLLQVLPNKVGRFIVFVPFLIIILRLPLIPFLLFLSFLSGPVLSNQWMDFSEISGYGRYECEIMQKGFQTLRLANGRAQKRRILSGLFLICH